MSFLKEIGRCIADEWSYLRNPQKGLPLSEQWLQAEKRLSPNQQGLFVKRALSNFAQKPAVVVNRGMIEASSLPQPVKNFLLNPTQGEGISWQEDWTAEIKTDGAKKGAGVSGGEYEAQVGMYGGRVNCHVLIATSRHIIPISDGAFKDSPVVGYEKELQRLVQARGEFGVMGELVRFISEAYQSHDAVERLLLSCREKQGQDGRTAFLESPFQGSHIRLQVRDGCDIDPNYASPRNIACVVEFTTTSSNIPLAKQIESKRLIPFSINHVGVGSRVLAADTQKNSVIIFNDYTALLVEKKAEEVSTAPVSLQLLGLLTRKVADAKVLSGN